MKTGAKVRKARKRALLTQGELAEKAGVGVTTVIRVERGQVEPHPHTVKLLAAALGVRAVALVADEGGPSEATLTRDATAYAARQVSPDS
jgi:transcriptional regulator with XRE-family HTH domain